MCEIGKYRKGIGEINFLKTVCLIKAGGFVIIRRIYMKKIAFIGMGNMAFAMLKGVETIFSREEIIFSRKDGKKREQFSKEFQIEGAKDNVSCAKEAKYIILAVKPQFFPTVLEEIKPVIGAEHILISIAAGVDRKTIKKILGDKIRVVRAMPNTPALLGEGMTGVCYQEEEFSSEEIQTIEAIFSSFGRVKKVEEHLMDAVICVSGSSPAYVYLFIEALADSGVKYGLSRETAYEMAAQTVLGAAKMVLETKEHPGVLKDRVCSPGGTTIAGVAACEEYGLRNAILKATDACYQKANQLGGKSNETKASQ